MAIQSLGKRLLSKGVRDPSEGFEVPFELIQGRCRVDTIRYGFKAEAIQAKMDPVVCLRRIQKEMARLAPCSVLCLRRLL